MAYDYVQVSSGLWAPGSAPCDRRCTMDSPSEITLLLAAARDGDARSLERLVPLVYDELRAIAHRQRGNAGTLNTTAVVHEAYLKVFGRGKTAPKDRSHFFGVVCLAMRQVLRDHARRHLAQKRGGGQAALPLELHDAAVEQDLASFLELDQALERLAVASPRLAEVVQLRYFAGLSVEEVAELQGVTQRTVLRDWRKARAFLLVQLDPDGEAPRND